MLPSLLPFSEGTATCWHRAWLSVIQGDLEATALFESLLVVIKLQKEVRYDPYYNRMRQVLGSVIQLTDLISSFLPANG